MKYTIGMDIGGTNTDAVLLDPNNKIIASVKSPTTRDISSGVGNALKKLLEMANAQADSVRAIYLGTTHATNAILQGRDLFKVGLIRIAGHHPDSLPPCYTWPQELKETVFVGSVTVGGGYECHSAPITPFDRAEVRAAVEKLLALGAESLAIIGVFSPLKYDQELEAAQIALEVDDIPLSLSHHVGGIGFIERENTALLNAALKKVMAKGFRDIETTLSNLQLNCPLYITQNNGCIISLEEAIDIPVLTISAGPTNSFIGASRLTGIQDAVIVDIGGTSTDVGLVKKGFPKRSLNTSNIGGIRLNFPMPDVLSIALGGGSYVEVHQNNRFQIGPQSAGMNVLTEAFCFGGDRLTFTDVAVAGGHAQINGANAQQVKIDTQQAQSILKHAFERIENEVILMEAGQRDVPVLLVGGGAALMPKEMLSNRYMVPEYAGVANAFGAALAEISGTVDTVVSLTNREAVLQRLQEEAIDAAVEKGARRDTTRVIDLQIIPYHYMPDHLARITVVAAGRQN
ncbi:MAG: hydantoinase/oxoprolinase family protein [Chlamydiales bacterium]|nr:hydantoinase/oxoprolinase family protein [Chlamydiales bacterium]